MLKLFGWLGSLVGGAVGFFAAWVSKNVAIGLALVTTFGVLTVAMIGVISTTMSAVVATAGVGVLPDAVAFGMSYFAPDNLVFCISSAIAGRVSVTAYDWNVQNLRFMSQK